MKPIIVNPEFALKPYGNYPAKYTFAQKSRTVERPFYPVNKADYEKLVEANVDVFACGDRLWTFGPADGGYALMPLKIEHTGMVEPVTVEPCPVCKGKGQQTLTVHESGKAPSTLKIPCVFCNGQKTVSQTRAKEIRDMQNAWCKCAKPGEPVFHPDGNVYAGKHCYTCSTCNKLIQVG